MDIKGVARYPGTCRNCRKPIGVGEQMYTSTSKPGMFHVKCNVAQVSQTGISQFVKPKVKKQTGISQVQKPLLVPNGLAYLPYQEDGIRHCVARNATLLADEMGLGKTIQAIGYINQFPQLRTIAIVTPTSLRINWYNELKTWLVRDSLRIIGFFPEVEIAGLDVAIIPYTALEMVPGSYTPELLILDEAHYVKNPDTLRSRWLKRLAMRTPKKLFLSGSPLENRVAEVWTLLQMLDPETWDPPGFVKGKMVGAGNGAGWVRFAKRHCGGRLVTHSWTTTKDANGKPKKREKKHFVFDGSTHLDELNKRLRETVMLRRLKKDVLKDLPPKRRQIITLPRDGASDAIDREHAAFVASGLDYSSDLEQLNKASLEFQELAAARKAVGLAKVPAIVEHLTNCLANGIEAIVVFTHHKEVAWKIADEFLEYQPAVYTGDSTEAMRDLAVRRFQNGATPLFIGTIGAAGVGLTLTRASHGVFAEFQWKDMSQAEDRIHRITQMYPVLLQYLVYDWSVDINMLKLVWKKMKIVEKTLNEQQPVS